MDDFKKIMYGVIAGFAALIVVWLLYLFISSCGFDVTCKKGAAPIEGTPVPTLSAAHVSAPEMGMAGEFNKCQVKALDLLAAWVNADYPETEAFEFTDLRGVRCAGTYEADIKPLLVESQLWFHASLSCT
ncbi:MAG: hypothetical protein AB1750_19905, partial [Chloroflexota bacterium]